MNEIVREIRSVDVLSDLERRLIERVAREHCDWSQTRLCVYMLGRRGGGGHARVVAPHDEAIEIGVEIESYGAWAYAWDVANSKSDATRIVEPQLHVVDKLEPKACD
jgi:hypothetical protein